MRIIVGLGNPEKSYKGTRHNVGFEVINKLAYDFKIEINRAKFSSHFGEGTISGQKVMLVKPQTYMNLSGIAVRDILGFYKLEMDNVIVVYDDTSLPLGNIRVRSEGSAGGHNGIKNIIYHTETLVFDRVRVGIGEKPASWNLADYVTSRFKSEEVETIIEGYTKGADAVVEILTNGISSTMNKYNTRTHKTPIT